MRILCLLSLLVGCALGGLQAQTRKIDHRSHSGAAATYALLMDEDHLGLGNIKEPNYVVEPFVQRIRKHYEKIARQIPDPKVEASTQNEPSVNPVVKDSVPQQNLQQPAPLLPEHKPAKKPKSLKSAALPADIPSPDFLLQEQIKASKADVAAPEPPRKSGLWMLLGLLAFPIAPGVFLASAIAGRKRKVA
jgi:hypothetical protein